MPGPVSDSFDPEFGTASNREAISERTRRIETRIATKLGPALMNIVEVATGRSGPTFDIRFTEQDLRVIRFCVRRFRDE